MQQTLINGKVLIMHHAPCNCQRRRNVRQTLIKAKSLTSRRCQRRYLPSHPATHHQTTSQQASSFDKQCNTALHLSLPANSHDRRRGLRLDRESISSLTLAGVIEVLFSSAAVTRSGIAFAFFTSSSLTPLLTRSLNKPPTTCLITLYPIHHIDFKLPKSHPNRQSNHVELQPDHRQDQCPEIEGGRLACQRDPSALPCNL
jgi:hypothetical protein